MKKKGIAFWVVLIWVGNTLIWGASALINRLYDHVGDTTPKWAVWLYLLCAAISLAAAFRAYHHYYKKK